jgi:hypothetical protein
MPTLALAPSPRASSGGSAPRRRLAQCRLAARLVPPPAEAATTPLAFVPARRRIPRAVGPPSLPLPAASVPSPWSLRGGRPLPTSTLSETSRFSTRLAQASCFLPLHPHPTTIPRATKTCSLASASRLGDGLIFGVAGAALGAAAVALGAEPLALAHTLAASRILTLLLTSSSLPRARAALATRRLVSSSLSSFTGALRGRARCLPRTACR